MRYIELDHSIETIDIDDGKGKIEQIKVSLRDILDQNCWGAPEWRQDEAWVAAWDRLVPKFDVAFKEKLRFIGVDDKDFEKFWPLGTLKGKNIPPQMARPFTRLTACILRASSKEPAKLNTKTEEPKDIEAVPAD